MELLSPATSDELEDLHRQANSSLREVSRIHSQAMGMYLQSRVEWWPAEWQSGSGVSTRRGRVAGMGVWFSSRWQGWVYLVVGVWSPDTLFLSGPFWCKSTTEYFTRLFQLLPASFQFWFSSAFLSLYWIQFSKSELVLFCLATCPSFLRLQLEVYFCLL